MTDVKLAPQVMYKQTDKKLQGSSFDLSNTWRALNKALTANVSELTCSRPTLQAFLCHCMII